MSESLIAEARRAVDVLGRDLPHYAALLTTLADALERTQETLRVIADTDSHVLSDEHAAWMRQLARDRLVNP